MYLDFEMLGDDLETNRLTDSTEDISPSKNRVKFTLNGQSLTHHETDDGHSILKTHLTSFLMKNRSSHRNSSNSSLYSNEDTLDEDEPNHHQKWSDNRQVRAWLISLLSALYALVLVIMSLAFEVSILVVGEIVLSKYDMFYIYLYLTGLAFLAYCQIFLLRTKGWKFSWLKRKPKDDSIQASLESAVQATVNARPIMRTKNVSHSAENTGSLYLRLGAVVFGIVGLIDHGLQMFRAFDSGQISLCYSMVGLVENFLFILFIFVQLYFLFQNSKMVIRRFKHIGRFGMMHLTATNMCIWIRGIVSELLHVMHEIEHSIHQESLKHFSNISDHHRLTRKSNDQTSVVVLHDAMAATSSDLGCFQIQKGMDNLLGNAKPFMTTCLVEYSLICAAFMFILWRNIGHKSRKRSKVHRNNVHVDCSSSTKGLFVGLIFVAFVIISMCIFFTKLQEDQSAALWVLQFSDFALYSVSIFAVAAGFWRMRSLTYVQRNHKEGMLDDILLIVGLIGQLMFCVFSMVALNHSNITSTMIVCVSLLRMVQVLSQTVFILCAQRLMALTPELQSKKPGREIVTFLLLCNVAMFLINTFETQKASANTLTSDFYGESIWMMIVYGTVPLTIFYRFHSSVCFAEIWKVSYRVKKHDDL